MKRKQHALNKFKTKSKSKNQKNIQRNNGTTKSKNSTFIQRGKQMESLHRKQKILEDKYKQQFNKQTAIDYENQYDEDDKLVGMDEDEHSFDILLSTISKSKTRNCCSGINVVADDNDSKIDDDTAGVRSLRFESKAHNNFKNSNPENSSIDHESEKTSPRASLSAPSTHDSFSMHLEYELSSENVESFASVSNKNYNKFCVDWSALGTLNVELSKIPNFVDSQRLTEFYKLHEKTRKCEISSVKQLEHEYNVKSQIAKNISLPLTSRQSEIFTIMNNYQDIYYAEQSLDNAKEVKAAYCMHALNHILKTRSRIIHHNNKLAADTSSKSSKSKHGIIPDSFRDQGLVRPKILFLVPFRESASQLLTVITHLLYGDNAGASKKNGTIINHDRFVTEYTGNTLYFPKTNPKPEDYEKIFSGNTDDNFRIGISLTKKCLKLYTDFYSSDIIIASPLALRTVVGDQDSKERDYDFLNSIELLIIDQAEILFAQNWENVLHVLRHMHLPLKTLHDTNFQRVRPWYLNGYSQFYRQTALLCSHELPEFRALFNNNCANYRGKVRISNPVKFGEIRNVLVSTSQVFQRIDVNDFESVFDRRFEYFVQEILSRFRSPSYAHCMIYIPSYFDFVRLRNYFKSETISCVQICEYTKKEKIARARDIFFHSGAHFLLYSERSHFFRRTRIKGIRHLIMYQPPMWPHFYSEIINLMHESNQNNRDGLESSMSITVLYTKYDSMQLSGILGAENAAKLLKSTSSVHAFEAQ